MEKNSSSDKHNIRHENFESKLVELKKISSSENTGVTLSKFQNEGGLFGWFSHKVTGDEMNNFTGELQAHFSQMNVLFNTVFKEIQSVYSVLDVLDKEYLTDITKSLNASVKAFEKAQSAQDDINKGVRVLEKTVGKLKEFSEKLKAKEHFEDIDTMWTDICSLKNDIVSLSKSANREINSLKKNVLRLQKVSDSLNRISHLHDIDAIWKDLHDVIERLSAQNTRFKRLSGDFQTVSDNLGFAVERIGALESNYEKLNEKTTAFIEQTETSFRYTEEAIRSIADSTEKNRCCHEELTEKTDAFIEQTDRRFRHTEEAIHSVADSTERNRCCHEELAEKTDAYIEQTDRELRKTKEAIRSVADSAERNRCRHEELIEKTDAFMKQTADSFHQAEVKTDKILEDLDIQRNTQDALLRDTAATGAYIEQLQSYEHLGDVDKEWGYSHGLGEKLLDTTERVSNEEEETKLLKERLATCETENMMLKTRLTIAFSIAGGAVVISLVQLVLRIAGIL